MDCAGIFPHMKSFYITRGEIMVVEINEMIDALEEFFNSSGHEFIVGGIAGTEIEKYVLDAAAQVTDFSKILILNGCQDYIGLMKKPLPNYVFWADIFIEQFSNALEPDDPWKPKILKHSYECINVINTRMISAYDVMIVFNAHLIPNIHEIIESFCGKVVCVIDPIEAGFVYAADLIRHALMITDSLSKVSPMVAMARATVGYDSRSIDTKVRGTLTEISSMNSRSIGKMDDKQYVSQDCELCYNIGKRQKESQLKKNQKLIVVRNENPSIIRVETDDKTRNTTITTRSLLVVENPNRKPLMKTKMRIFNSKTTCYVDTTYQYGMLTPKGSVCVLPANIISLNEMIHHRFNDVVFIMNGYRLSEQEKYVLLKNSNNVTIVSEVK